MMLKIEILQELCLALFEQCPCNRVEIPGLGEDILFDRELKG